ncbi:Mov34/MPN/PAD-1 family protein [Archangium lansingense]|uniref:Mov34/MPN/PAD-1 family protein n=1 Tax=Archangium lansingense TaxID=2995310 RepID=UPI00358DC712
MPALEFRSADARFRVYVPGATVRRLLHLCRSSGTMETGGILVGGYSATLDCARVRAASDPPTDSVRGPSSFQRGTRGLQVWLERRWASRGEHYLGEWHFHPYAAPVPSGTDLQQLGRIARTADYRCPEPILLIVGGDPAGAWLISAHVVPSGQAAVPLQRLPDLAESDFVRRSYGSD